MHPALYEISAWPWLERLSRACGRTITLAGVPPAAWDEIARRGVTLVYLMGVWRRSAIGREIARHHQGLRDEYDRTLPGWTEDDVPGSPYSVAAYEPDERMGGWPGLDAARQALRARGVRLMLDFVPNHTGFDHPWIAAHPEYYVLGAEEDHRRAPADFRPMETHDGRTVLVACGRDPNFGPWTDVAQLNYFNPAARAALCGVLREIAAHCDGVRCDMAMLVLNDVFDGTWRPVLGERWPALADEFWPGVTAGAPDFTYLAEVYWNLEGTLLAQGFDFACDKRLADALHGPEPAARVRELLDADRPPAGQLARFLENHDEPRSAATLAGRLIAAAALNTTLPGLRFYYDGQFEGRRVKAPVQLGRWPDEPPDQGVREMYERMLGFASRTLVAGSEWRLLSVSVAGDHSYRDIVCYRWKRGEDLAVVAVNLGGAASQAHVWLAEDLPEGDAFDFTDGLTGACYRWRRDPLASTGLYVRLEAWSAHLFAVTVTPDGVIT